MHPEDHIANLEAMEEYHRLQDEVRKLYDTADLENVKRYFPPPPAEAMEPVKFVDHLADTVFWHHPRLLHPFVMRLWRGLLTDEEIRGWVKIHYPQLVQVIRNDAMSVAGAKDLEEMRKEMLVLIEEAGEDLVGGDTPAHPQMWLHLGESLGLTDKEIEDAPLHPHYESFIMKAQLSSMQKRIGAEAPRNSRLGERTFSVVAPLWAEALKTHYGASERGVTYFYAHGEQDWLHGAIGKELLVPYVQTQEGQRIAWLKERDGIFRIWERHDAWADAANFYRRMAALEAGVM